MFSKNKSTESIPYREAPFCQRAIQFVGINGTLPNPLTPEQFQEKLHLSYLPLLEFESEGTLLKVKKESRRLVERTSIGTEAKWNGALYKRELYYGAVGAVSVRWMGEEKGYGAFAEKEMEGGEWIGEYTGVVRPYRLFSSGLNAYCFRYPTYNVWFRVFFIDALSKGNETRFLNHSDTPNCESIIAYADELLHICIRACRRIHKGEELTFDYGNTWWGMRSKFSLAE